MKKIAGLRILLIEDEPIVAVLAEDMLEALGCVVAATVGTVADAQAAILTLAFDVAMVDINLDDEDGMAVAANLSARKTPYLITTGYAVSTLTSGHPDATILLKPYTLTALEHAIARCVERN